MIFSLLGTNATTTGWVVGIALLAVLVIVILVAILIQKGRKLSTTRYNHTEHVHVIKPLANLVISYLLLSFSSLAKRKASKDDIQTSECAAYHPVRHHRVSTTNEVSHATDTTHQNPVYENAQPKPVERPADHIYEVISRV